MTAIEWVCFGFLLAAWTNSVWWFGRSWYSQGLPDWIEGHFWPDGYFQASAIHPAGFSSGSFF